MYRSVFLIVFLIVFDATHLAQVADTIFLMNGQIFPGVVADTNVTVSVNDGEKKLLTYETDQLFKIRFSNGVNRFYYTEDSLAGNWLSREEMWMYMKGERDARKGFKARGALFGAAAVGVIGGMTGTFWGPVLPYGYMALSGIPKIRIKHGTVSDLNDLKSEGYLMGYERVARQKLKIKSLIGGTAGLAIGYSIYLLFHDQYPGSGN